MIAGTCLFLLGEPRRRGTADDPALAHLPVFVQAAELHAARRTPDYTLPELIDRSRFEQVTGPADIPAWMDILQQLDPRIVYFAHDRCVWTP